MNRRRVAVLLIVAGLLAGCEPAEPGDSAGDPPGPPPSRPVPTIRAPTSSTSPSPPAPTCPAAGVRVEAGDLDAAMGLRALAVHLVNCGHQTYRVAGYPEVRALDKARKPLNIRVLQGVTDIAGSIPGWSAPPRPVTLEPGRRASVVVVWRSTYDDIRRPPVNPPYLSIAPAPGQAAQVVAPAGGLDLGSTGRLGVSPWTAPE